MSMYILSVNVIYTWETVFLKIKYILFTYYVEKMKIFPVNWKSIHENVNWFERS